MYFVPSKVETPTSKPLGMSQRAFVVVVVVLGGSSLVWCPHPCPAPPSPTRAERERGGGGGGVTRGRARHRPEGGSRAPEGGSRHGWGTRGRVKARGHQREGQGTGGGTWQGTGGGMARHGLCSSLFL
jgi:hypothetical protein